MQKEKSEEIPVTYKVIRGVAKLTEGAGKVATAGYKTAMFGYMCLGLGAILTKYAFKAVLGIGTK